MHTFVFSELRNSTSYGLHIFLLNLIFIGMLYQPCIEECLAGKYKRMRTKMKVIGTVKGLFTGQWNTLQWRYYGRDSVSNYQPHECLLNRLFNCRSKKASKLRVTGLVRGINRELVNYPHTWPVARKMFPFDDVIVINRILVKGFRSIAKIWK